MMVSAMWGQTSPARRPPAAKPAAPKPAAGVEHWPIKAFQVEGNSFYTPRQVVDASGLKMGDLATKENFERARDRILATGSFESFGWRYEARPEIGMVAVLQVTEAAQFHPWTLDRLPFTREEVAARVKKSLPLFAEKIPPSDLFMDRVCAVLTEMLKEKGLSEPVQGRVLLISTDQIAVVFGPKTPPPNVTEVKFTGTRILDARYLTKALAAVAVGSPYIESNFRLFLEHQIKPMYETVGRLRVSFPKLTVEPSKTAKGVVVTVQVEEGVPYKLEKIEVTGAPMSAEEIQELGQFKTDEPVNFSDIGKGLERVMRTLKVQGYMKSSYKAKQELNDTAHTVKIFVEMEPGPQFMFGKLEIKGLDLETEPVVRKLWALKPGEVYRQGYEEMFLNQIRDRGIFDNLGQTKADVNVDEKRQVVDVLLIFKGEAAPQKPKPPL
jgi:outer membrane protein assembly factor BamA